MKAIKTQRGQRGGAFLTLATAALLALPAAAAPQIFAQISDENGEPIVEGESTHPSHGGWIDLTAFGQGINRYAETNHCDNNGFTFIKRLDKATPKIAEALCKGRVFPKVEIHYVSSSSAAPGGPPVTITLRHVQVLSHRLGNGNFNPLGASAGGGELPTEEITIGYTEVEWTYIELDPQGTPVDQVNVVLGGLLGTEDPMFDDDNDGLTNDLDDDDDNDGVSDWTELDNGMNPFLNDTHDDLDGDGQSNIDELTANTRLDDPSSYFGIARMRFRNSPNGPEGEVSLPVSGGRLYRLLGTPDPRLPKEAWFVIDEFEVPAGSPDTIVDIQLDSNLLQNAQGLFFAAEVSLLAPPSP